METISLKPTLPLVLTVTAGFVDTAGFLALQGLFTSHVTGNFVTLGAALVFGTSGALSKLLALPTFCAVIFVTRFLSYALPARGFPVLRTILTVKVVLLSIACVLAIRFGPFANGDTWPALLTGMTLVCAMAIQNAAQRAHLGSAPPTTVMTGTATQIMLDLADLLRTKSTEPKNPRRARLQRMTASVVAFAGGCAGAALMFSQVGVLCFLVPPVLGMCTLMFRLTQYDGEITPSPR
jgi:uncharacterized membrane protein YoaK (UPF0700 family)